MKNMGFEKIQAISNGLPMNSRDRGGAKIIPKE
jgi:hypothetical protein